MAADDRTEQPTPKRLEQARERGQVARSTDLSGAGVLMAGVIGVAMLGHELVEATGGAMSGIFEKISQPHTVASAAGLHGLMSLVLMTLLKTAAPIAALCLVAGVGLSVLQVGLRFTPKAIRPQFSRVSPVTGLRNLFSPDKLFELGKDLAKVAIVGGLVTLALIPDLTHLGASVGTTPAGLGVLIGSGAKDIVMRAAGAYLLIGGADYAWQRHRVKKNLMMTKQEVRDETKQKDLPPEIKRAIRRRQFQRARARMMAAVPQADVVVVNPTHYAVALQYGGDRPAPVVVAKGADHVAAQIRRIATEHEIPIVPNPPLARELYRTVEIDQMIPADLYAAVAKVLAFVYRLAARKRVGV